jgi:hypothetical protein
MTIPRRDPSAGITLLQRKDLMGVDQLHIKGSNGITSLDLLLVDRAVIETILARSARSRERQVDDDEIGTLCYCLVTHPKNQCTMQALIALLRQGTIQGLCHLPGEWLHGISQFLQDIACGIVKNPALSAAQERALILQFLLTDDLIARSMPALGITTAGMVGMVTNHPIKNKINRLITKAILITHLVLQEAIGLMGSVAVHPGIDHGSPGNQRKLRRQGFLVIESLAKHEGSTKKHT